MSDEKKDDEEKGELEIRKFYRYILDHTPAGMCIGKSDGRFLYVNQTYAGICGATKEELLERGWKPYVADPVASSSVLTDLEEGKIKEKSFEEEYRVENRKTFVKEIYRPIGYKGENAVLVGALDITELRERKMNLESAISNFGSVLSKVSRGDLTQRVDLSKISKEFHPIGKDMNTMINSLQDMINAIKNASGEVSNKAERIAGVSEETTMALKTISDSMGEIAKEAVKLSEMALKQSDGVMRQSSAVEETEAAIEEQTKGSEELSLIGQEMLGVSIELSKILKKFRSEKTK
jgi:PAS domain S-box-containing protein